MAVVAADWTAIGTLIAAAATVGLGAVTVWLVLTTRAMVGVAARQVGIEESRLAAAQRPEVYPVTLDEWVTYAEPYGAGRARHVIPVSNAGPGVAYDTTGMLRFTDGVFVPVIPLTIQPGQTLDARFDWGGHVYMEDEKWKNAHGFLVYNDVAGETWCTEYYVRYSNQRLFFEFERSGRLSEFGNLHERFGILLEAVRGEINRTLDRALRLSVEDRTAS